MKIGIFSDLHLHNYSAFGEPAGGGLNHRAVKSLDTLFQIYEKVDELDLEFLCFCGDMFEAKGNLSVPLIIAAKECLKLISDRMNILAVPGNHDIAVREKDSPTSIDIFEDLKYFVNVDKTVFPRGGEPWFIGMGADTELKDLEIMLKSKAKYMPKSNKGILLMHKTFKGTLISNTGYKAETGMSIREVEKFMQKHNIVYCFCGDIHIRQRLRDNIWYVGNPLQVGFGDTQEKGMLILDTDNWSVDFEELRSPKFISVDYANAKIDDYNYFSINTSNKEDFEEAQRLNAWNVKINPPPKEYSKDRTTIKMDMDVDNVLEEYVKMKNPLGKDRILKLGKSLLTEAKKE